MQKLLEILKLAEIEASPMGLAVVDTRLTQQGKHRSLEVTICRKGGRISLSDCELLSRKLEKVLDEQATPLIEGAFNLEVQSPGLDRQLKTEREFEIFSGEQVEVKIKENLPSLGYTFTGKLQSFCQGVLTIADPKPLEEASAKQKKKGKNNPKSQLDLPENISLEWSKVAQVRLRPGDPGPIALNEEQEENEN